jgi:5-methylcytosine-specific restriction endonuclease McrA
VAGSFCTVCRARIPRGSRCKRHRLQSPSSRAWHQPGAAKLRAQVLARDRDRCRVCGATEQVEVHHIVAAADGGANEASNLVSLCAEHHRAAERGEISLSRL